MLYYLRSRSVLLWSQASRPCHNDAASRGRHPERTRGSDPGSHSSVLNNAAPASCVLAARDRQHRAMVCSGGLADRGVLRPVRLVAVSWPSCSRSLAEASTTLAAHQGWIAANRVAGLLPFLVASSAWLTACLLYGKHKVHPSRRLVAGFCSSHRTFYRNRRPP